MNSDVNLPWLQIHEFLLSCGNIRKHRELCKQIIIRLQPLVPFDQARIYFVNDNGIVVDEELFGVDKRWSKLYLEYYSKIDNGRYAVLSKTKNGRFSIPHTQAMHDWTHSSDNEFISDYVKPQGIQYSLGFGLHDADNLAKCVFTLDRICHRKYTQQEVTILSVLQAHLDNLHKNLFFILRDFRYTEKLNCSDLPLTARELEIVELICSGVTSKNISNKLCLSLSTVYKHIANIYEKLNISSRSELIVKLMPEPIFTNNIDLL